MKRPLILTLILTLGLSAGCSYLTFQKKDVPPPLPPIEETKPPLKLTTEYFKAFPWPELPKPRKDGNDPDTFTYTVKEGDTLESIAESMMGAPSLAVGLAEFNELASPTSVKAGDKIVIPFPIIGMSSQIMVKGKKEKEFGSPVAFDVDFKKGDQYKLRFEPNVNGYCYILRQGAKGMTFLYPAQVKLSRRNRRAQPLMRDSGKAKAFEPIEIPMGNKGFLYDLKKAGDRVFVFLSLRTIPELEDLKEKTKIRVEEVEDVMHRVKEGGVVTDGPLRVLRIADPSEILGFVLNLSG